MQIRRPRVRSADDRAEATLSSYTLARATGRLHKERNVLDHLPEAKHAWVRCKLRAAWARHDADVAKRELEALARTLQRDHPGAAASLREGLEETLTVARLGVRGPLLKTVFSTNPIESMIEIVREHASTVKR